MVRAVSVSRPTLDDVHLAATGGRTQSPPTRTARVEDGQDAGQGAGWPEGGHRERRRPRCRTRPRQDLTGEPQTLAAPAGLVSDVAAITGRAIRGILREPELFIFALIIPVFFFVVQIGALADVAEQTLGIPEYAAFQLPISILFAAASTSGGNALVLDIAGGYWDKLSPTWPTGRRWWSATCSARCSRSSATAWSCCCSGSRSGSGSKATRSSGRWGCSR